MVVGAMVLLSVSSAHAVEGQVAQGRKLYAVHCAHCHGDAGQGTKRGPPLIGASALPLEPPMGAKLRKSSFATAKDVLDFITANMPGKKPGSLAAEEYAAVLAFELKSNGVDMDNKKLDAGTAATILLRK
jgi:mono/diheme cytochrome c family protein